jgi:hypothetical protein
MSIRLFSWTFDELMFVKNAVFWDVSLCRSCMNRRFGGLYRLHLQGRKIRERGTSVNRCLHISTRIQVLKLYQFVCLFVLAPTRFFYALREIYYGDSCMSRRGNCCLHSDLSTLTHLREIMYLVYVHTSYRYFGFVGDSTYMECHTQPTP